MATGSSRKALWAVRDVFPFVVVVACPWVRLLCHRQWSQSADAARMELESAISTISGGKPGFLMRDDITISGSTPRLRMDMVLKVPDKTNPLHAEPARSTQ